MMNKQRGGFYSPGESDAIPDEQVGVRDRVRYRVRLRRRMRVQKRKLRKMVPLTKLSQYP